MRVIKFLGFLCFVIALSGSSFKSHAQNKQYVEMGLTALNIEGKSILAVSFNNTKGWHTYWKNPGDAGQEIDVTFYQGNKEITLKDYPWPAPKRYIEQGNMWAYGYSNKYALFYELPENLSNSPVKVEGKWLVCKDICIPGEKNLDISILNKVGKTNPQLSNAQLTQDFKKLPENSTSDKIDIYLTKAGDEKLALHYMIENVDFTKVSLQKNILTPYPVELFDFKHEEVYLDRVNNILYGRAYIDWDGVYEEPALPLPSDGIFPSGMETKFLFNYPKNNNAKILSINFKEFSLTGNESLDKLFSTLERLGDKKADKPTESEKSIFLYILFAFLGGLILNLMPCVLPVISLKLFGLIVHSDESKKQILKHNLAYTFGVLISFLALAFVVFGLKASGQNIGWGFQLQSPTFVFIMLVVILIMSMNMFGLYEFVTPGGKKLGNVEMKKGLSGDIVNGILATILSTPCSAPFLGAALGFAFTTSSINIFIIFISVGLGLSFPFILTGFFPKLINFLPKPGLWMDKLKKLLGLSLLLTAIWLYDVFSALTDMSMTGIYINTVLALIFFAFYFRKNFSNKLVPSIAVFLLPILLLVQSCRMGAFEVQTESKTSGKENRQGLTWNKWTPSKMNASDGKLTFVNFTASWCLTCKVNKKLVLDTSDFAELVKDKNIQLLEGDWTKRDEDITNFLKSYGIVGVPAYFIKKSDGNIISLGETISISKIKEKL